MKSLLSIAMSLVTVGGALAEAPGSDDLRDFVGEYQQVWQSHDAERLAEFFTEDADMILGIQPRIEGRGAVAKWWQGYFSRIDRGRRLTIEIDTLRLLSPDVALLNVRTTTGGTHSRTGETLEPRRARGTWIVTRAGERWTIAALRAHSPVGELREAPGTDD